MNNKHFWSGWFTQSSTPVQEEKVEEKLYDEYTLILLNPDGEKIPASLKIDKYNLRMNWYARAFELSVNKYWSHCLILHQNYKHIFTNKTIVRYEYIYSSGDNVLIGDSESEMRKIQNIYITPYPGLLISEFIGRPYEILECEKVED